jgi:hypothetical protein
MRLSADEHRNRREQKRRGHQVVLGGSRLADDQRVALEEHSSCDGRQRGAAIGPADAPG